MAKDRDFDSITRETTDGLTDNAKECIDTTIQEYYELVKQYCSLVESLVISRELVEELMSIILMALLQGDVRQ